MREAQPQSQQILEDKNKNKNSNNNQQDKRNMVNNNSYSYSYSYSYMYNDENGNKINRGDIDNKSKYNHHKQQVIASSISDNVVLFGSAPMYPVDRYSEHGNYNQLQLLSVNRHISNSHGHKLLQYHHNSNGYFHAYYISSGINWDNAESYCNTQGYTLASIHDSTQNSQAFNSYGDSGSRAWIGLNDIDFENIFVYTDGTSFDYENWGDGQPDNAGGNENCVHFGSGGFWNDLSCTDTSVTYFICANNYDCNATTDNTYGLHGISCEIAVLWQEAETYCNDMYGTNLASIHGTAENTAAQTIVSSNSAWIGFNDITSEGTFAWEDVSPHDYDNWNSGEPNDSGSNQDCVHLWTDGTWNDHDCSTQKFNYFVCNVANPTPRPTSQPTPQPSLAPSNPPALPPTDTPTDTPSDAPTDIPSYAPSNAPVLLPTMMSTAIPSVTPTAAPTTASSGIPSISLSLAPTRVPSIAPSDTLTAAPTLSPTSLPSSFLTSPAVNVSATGVYNTTGNLTTKATDESTSSNDTRTKSVDGVRIGSGLNNVQQIGFLIVIVAYVIILLIRLIYRTIPRYQNTDMPYFGYVVKFIFQMMDVLSDISVAELMYINDDLEYFYLTMTFIILPLIIAIFCLFYFKFYEWNLKSNKKMSQKYAVSQRIANYFDKYWILVLVWCILSCNFYSAIALSQCKIFCLSMFNLQLKRKEYESLAIIKFINCTICENIGQIMIQIFYLQHINDHSLLVYISLVFSVFSILSQIVIFLTQLNNILIEYNKHVTQILSFDIKIQLSCHRLKAKHEFSNELIEKSLINAFNMSQKSDKWNDRGDITVKHEVYFIDGCKLEANHSMDVYFNTTISCYNDTDSAVRDALESTIYQLATNQHSKVQKQFLNNVKFCFGFHHSSSSRKKKRNIKIKIISNQFKIIDKKLIDKEFQNGFLSRLSVWRSAVVDTLPTINLQFYQLRIPQQPKVSANNIVQLAHVTNDRGVTPASRSPSSTIGGVDNMHDDDDDDDDMDDNSVAIDSSTNKGTMTSNGEENVEIVVPKMSIDDANSGHLEYGYQDLNAESEGLAERVPKEGESLTGAAQ